MKTLMTILGCLFIAALLAPLLHAAATAFTQANPGSLRSMKRALGLHAGILQCNAITDGIHANGLLGHLLSDAAHTARHLVVRRGSDADHFALGTAAAEPLGICLDTPAAAEATGAVALLGVTPGTLRAVGSEAIAIDAEVYCAANGKVQDRPTVAGSYWRIGKAVTPCTGDGDQFEVAHHAPVRVSILANAADLTAVKAAATAPSQIMFLGA
jgi:hypothetical protein